eukprot:8795588-Alexandrium_andersonii.AAC.1
MAMETGRFQKAFGAIKELRLAGLSDHWAGALLRQYAGAASQYVLRLGAAALEEARKYDAALRQA